MKYSKKCAKTGVSVLHHERTFKAQFMKKLSNTMADLKKSVAY